MAKSKIENQKSKMQAGESMAADDGSKTPFDARTIKELVALMSRHNLYEIDLRQGEMRIRLRSWGAQGRGDTETRRHGEEAVPASPRPPVSASPKPPGKEPLTIKSPTPGTFYAASSPDAEPFVRVGSKVTPTTVVCVIEAMKIFNEITADCSGVITEILAENQQPVEYGQILFKVDPAG